MNKIDELKRTLANDQLDHLFDVVYQDDKLTLLKKDEPKLGGVAVDFIHGTLAHRRVYGGGRGEAIAKAVGIKKSYLPTVYDATAGLGRDGFVLASVGCAVTLFERNKIVRALLADGLSRAYQDAQIGELLKTHLILAEQTSIFDLSLPANNQNLPDVVYLDPMFPARQKSALVKKEMRLFHDLVGADIDSDNLLTKALKLAKKRVVVKRPSVAPYLNNTPPSFSNQTKNHRFDVYLTNPK